MNRFPVVSASAEPAQLSLQFEPGLSEMYGSTLDVIRSSVELDVAAGRALMKGIAADLDMSSSELARKLAGNPDDPRHFTLADFDRYLSERKDMRPLYYLIEKHLASEQDKAARALHQVQNLAPQLIAVLAQLAPQFAAVPQAANQPRVAPVAAATSRRKGG
jgi:hypothetical protein